MGEFFNSRIHNSKRLIRSAAFMSLAGFAVLFAFLGQPGASQRPVPFMDSGAECVATSRSTMNVAIIPLNADGRDGQNFRSSVELETDSARSLLASKKIGLLMLADQKTATVLHAEMVFSEKTSKKVTSKYEVRKGTLIRENRKLDFDRDLQFSSETGSDSQLVTIRIYSTGAPSLALKGQFSADLPPSKMLWVRQTSDQGVSGFASPSGWIDSKGRSETFSKAQLLAYIWGFGINGARFVYSLLVIAAAVWLVGVFALTSGRVRDGTSESAIPLALGVVCLFAATGLTYLTISPPFQGPDEPDHFLTYTRLNNLPALADDALTVANSGHFERIKFRTDEKFSAADVHSPMAGSWAHHIDPNNPNRSPFAKRAWIHTAKLIDFNHAGVALVCLRLMDVLFVSACVGVSIGLAAWSLRGGGQPIFMVAPLLLTPSICYFSTVLSNYPFLIGGYIFQATALGLVWQSSTWGTKETRFWATTGFLAGLGVLIAFVASDNGIFSLAFWGLLIPLIFLLSSSRLDGGEQRLPPCLRTFHIAFASPFLLIFVIRMFRGPDYLILPEMLVWSVENKLPLNLRGFLSLETWVLFMFPAGCFVISMLAYRVGLLIRNTSLIRHGRRVAAGIILFGVIMILLRLAIPVREYVEPLITGGLSSAVFTFVCNFLEGFGPGRTNSLVVDSFWGSLGWLDTPLPRFLIDTLRFVTAAGVLALFLISLSKKYPQRLGLLASTLFALLLYAIFLSAGYWAFNFAPNSRYLIGLYLLTMVVAYEGIRLVVIAFGNRPHINLPVNAAFCLVCMTLQCTAWLSILSRYF